LFYDFAGFVDVCGYIEILGEFDEFLDLLMLLGLIEESVRCGYGGHKGGGG
jgi:hypothetical protein